jgi:hypothetical protein
VSLLGFIAEPPWFWWRVGAWQVGPQSARNSLSRGAGTIMRPVEADILVCDRGSPYRKSHFFVMPSRQMRRARRRVRTALRRSGSPVAAISLAFDRQVVVDHLDLDCRHAVRKAFVGFSGFRASSNFVDGHRARSGRHPRHHQASGHSSFATRRRMSADCAQRPSPLVQKSSRPCEKSIPCWPLAKLESCMTHIDGFEVTSFCCAVGDCVGSDNPVRFIDAFVAGLKRDGKSGVSGKRRDAREGGTAKSDARFG